MDGIATRLSLFLLSLAYGAIALGNGLDRWSLTRSDPGLVPAPFAAMAHLRHASVALTENRSDQAIAAASQAILVAPVEPQSTSLLGSGYLVAGQSSKAYAAFKVARRLGWRDVGTQAYWIATGIVLSDPGMAAQHLDALMRVAPSLPQGGEMLVQLEATARGREALAARLREGPDWLNAYASAATRLGPPAFAQRLSLLQATAKQGRIPECSKVADAIRDLAYEQARFVDAFRIWRLACRRGTTGLVNDPGFALPPRDSELPFEWILPGTGGVSARLVPGELVASNDNPLEAIVAQQWVFAPMGPVRLSWTAATNGNAAELQKAATLTCADRRDLRIGTAAAGDGRGRFNLELLVPSACSPQLLTLRVSHGAGEVRFSRVELQRLGKAEQRP